MSVILLNCVGCGARLSEDDKTCKYCRAPVVIAKYQTAASLPILDRNKYAAAYRKSLERVPDDIDGNESLAMCYLSLKLYDKALGAFERAMDGNFERSEIYYYAALCLLNGKKPFLQTRATIDKALGYVQAAIMIEPKPVYFYFSAYVKFDYFHRKLFSIEPTYRDDLLQTYGKEIGQDVAELFEIVGQDPPEEFMR